MDAESEWFSNMKTEDHDKFMIVCSGSVSMNGIYSWATTQVQFANSKIEALRMRSQLSNNWANVAILKVTEVVSV